MTDLKTITLAELPKLKAAYDVAVAEDKEMFAFEDGREFVTTYAKYLIEHMENLLTKHTKK